MPDPRLDIHIRTSADTSGAKAAASAVKQAGDAAKEAGKAAQQSARNVNELGENFDRGAAAGRVLGQALQGNVFALTQLGPAIKVIATLIKTSLLGALIALGAAAAQIVVPFVAGFRKKKEAIEGASASVDTLKQKLAELEKAARESLQAQLAEVQKLREGYAELVGQIDAAEQRVAKANELAAKRQIAELNLQEQRALAAAKTDEERAGIQADFARRRELAGDSAAEIALENRLLNAGIREHNARQTITDARGRIDAARFATFAKTQARELADANFKAALERQRREPGEATDRAVREARDARTVAVQAEEAALENVRTVTIEAQQVISSAEQQIAAAQEIRANVPIEQQILGLERDARETARAVDVRGQRADLVRQAEEAMLRGDFATQDAAVAQLRRLDSAPSAQSVQVGAGDSRNIQKASAEQQAAAKEQAQLIIQGFEGTTKIIRHANRELQKQQTREKNSRP